MTSPWTFRGEDSSPRKSWFTKPIFIIILGVIVLAILLFVWYSMKNKMDEVDEANIPIITHSGIPFKEKPENPGGYIAPHADKSVYNLISKNKKPLSEKDVLVVQEDEEPLSHLRAETPPVETETVPSITASAPTSIISKGAYTTQLASLSSKDAAQKEWTRLQKKNPALLGTTPGNIQEAAVNGRTVFRIYAGQFSTKEEASTLCQKLQSLSLSCLVKKNS